MAVVIIPTRTDIGNYDFKISLDGSVFGISFVFNSREEFWYFDLTDSTGNAIRSGIKVVLGIPLLRLMAQTSRPLGEPIAVGPSGDAMEAGLEDLGDRVLLAYVEGTA